MRLNSIRVCSRIKNSNANVSLKQEYSTKGEYLHRSILPTNHFQECLPRLPVPKLEDTMEKYLRSLRALEGHPSINAASIRDTERSVHSFMLWEGPEIQKKLIEENSKNKHTSYVTQPWFDMYLESRLPLPLNYNPFISFKKDPNEAMNDQATRSTNFIIASMKFQKTFNEKRLSPEVFYMKDTAKSNSYKRLVKFLPNAFMLRYLPMAMNGAYPLDMSQFGNLLSSTRIPHLGKDVLQVYPKARHVLVIRDGHFYAVDALDADGNIADPVKVKSCIMEILADKRPRPEYSPGYMTTADRDTWASVRDHLVNIGNREVLEAMDSAVLCLVLDDATNTDTADGAVAAFLHGDGASRWFDKSFSLIVSATGDTALNFEHSWGDGVAVLRYFNEIFDETTQNPAISHDTPCLATDAGTMLNRLDFKIDDFTKQAINDAREGYEKATGSVKTAVGQYPKMYKNYLKQKKVSPDGILQLGIQVGHYRLYGHPTATYESCSTSAFKHGRTETIRSCTLEAQAVAKAIAEGTSGASNKLKDDCEYRKQVESLIRKSCDKHGELTKQAAMGQGFDRHMFGLRHTAEKVLGLKTPGIFLDPTYAIMNHIVLSTSTLSTHAAEFGGFAPVVPDGFGVGYGVREDMLGCNITSYDSRDVGALVDAIITSFDDIHTVLEGQ